MKWPGEIPAIFVWTSLFHDSSRRNRRNNVEMHKSLQPRLLPALAERAQPQGVELDGAGGVAMMAGNRPLNGGAFQLLSLSSLKMGEPSPLDSKPVSE
jgi:hypothetical protein